MGARHRSNHLSLLRARSRRKEPHQHRVKEKSMQKTNKVDADIERTIGAVFMNHDNTKPQKTIDNAVSKTEAFTEAKGNDLKVGNKTKTRKGPFLAKTPHPQSNKE